jgi:hypothetical protein
MMLRHSCTANKQANKNQELAGGVTQVVEHLLFKIKDLRKTG